MIPEILLQEIQKKRCLLFIGAGFSLNAELPDGNKMPTWDEFAEQLSRDFEEEKTEPLEITSFYEKRLGRNNLIKKITEVLHVHDAKPGKIHKKLSKINEFDTIVTTNYEFLLEQPYIVEGKRINVIVGDKNIAMYSPFTHTNIIKIHGDLRDHSELVITQDDYDNFLDEHPVLATNLAAWFTTRTPIFIGYSLKDPHFLQIRSLLKQMLGKFLNNWFVIKHDATDKEIEDAAKDGITIVRISTEGKTREESLLDFLCQIQDYVDTKNMDSLTFSSEKKSGAKSREDVKSHVMSTVINAFSDLEVKLRDTLEKFGYEQKDLRKPFSFLIQSALTVGILTTSDIGELSKITKIRNNTVHASAIPTLSEAHYVGTITKEIIKKLAKIKISTIKPVQIELFSDKFSYENDESVFLKGKVSKILDRSVPVSLIIIGPDKNLVSIAQIRVNTKGEFEFTISAGGALWKNSGEYLIKVMYGGESNQRIIAINYKQTEKIELNSQIELQINDETFPMPYFIQGGTIVGTYATLQTNVLTVQLETFTDGKLQIRIPRLLLDAKKKTADAPFLVLLDGEEIGIEENQYPDGRELIISFEKGTEEIMIVGTSSIGGKPKKESNIIEILEGSGAPKEDEKYLKPQSMIIKKGQTVTWDNVDTAAHALISGTPEGGPDGNFDSKLFMAGEKFSHKFEKKGTYRYFCLVHPWKEGKIIVTD